MTTRTLIQAGAHFRVGGAGLIEERAACRFIGDLQGGVEKEQFDLAVGVWHHGFSWEFSCLRIIASSADLA